MPMLIWSMEKAQPPREPVLMSRIFLAPMVVVTPLLSRMKLVKPKLPGLLPEKVEKLPGRLIVRLGM